MSALLPHFSTANQAAKLFAQLQPSVFARRNYKIYTYPICAYTASRRQLQNEKLYTRVSFLRQNTFLLISTAPGALLRAEQTMRRGRFN